MKRLVVTILGLALLTTSCAAGKLYEANREEPDDYEGALSVCEDYYSPPFYYFCGVVTRLTCQQYEQYLDICMERRGWRRTR